MYERYWYIFIEYLYKIYYDKAYTLQIEEFCDKSIWIKNGKIEMIGNCKEVHEKYKYYMLVYNKFNK